MRRSLSQAPETAGPEDRLAHPGEVEEVLQVRVPSLAHSVDAALLSDLVIMARSRVVSLPVRNRCWSSALRSVAPRMITFTMLAESKCADPLSEQVTPAPGASTHTATVETRPRRAAWMSRATAAATAAWVVDVHATCPRKPAQAYSDPLPRIW